jgi:hypothetical protein
MATFFRKEFYKVVAYLDTYIQLSFKKSIANPSEIFLSRNGSPQENVRKVIELAGGIEKLIGKGDIVILKPNAQWWNQGRTNLAAMKGFIDLVLEIPGFEGEIIIAENNHFMDNSLPADEWDNVRGWVHFSEINGDIDGTNHNLNTLIALYNDAGIANVSKYHWRDGGPKGDIWGNGQNGGIVESPAEGDGYIWSDLDYEFSGYFGMKKWKVKMTYPVFTSKYSGITIDLKDGAFQRDTHGGGTYLPNRPVKLINFAALNHHGGDTGITSATKNYMGITDLSCGWWGKEPEGYFNIHAVGEENYPHAMAGPIGFFMKHIRKADFNIVTAEWIGWGHRTDITKASRIKTILAGFDPLSLDYYGAKYLVLPLSNNHAMHNPTHKSNPVHKFLNLAQSVAGEGAISDSDIIPYEFDHNV